MTLFCLNKIIFSIWYVILLYKVHMTEKWCHLANHRCICSGHSVCQNFWFLSDSPLNSKRYALHRTRSKHASAYVESLNKSYHYFTGIWETITVDFLLLSIPLSEAMQYTTEVHLFLILIRNTSPLKNTVKLN